MSSNDDSECMPDAEALARFRQCDDTKAPSPGTAFWNMLDLSEDKRAELESRLRQREAVTMLVKEDLGQKLQTFNILYYVTFVIVLFLFALVIRHSHYPGGLDRLKLLAASNGAYYCFIMLLALFYQLAHKVRWFLTVAALIFIAA